MVLPQYDDYDPLYPNGPSRRLSEKSSLVRALKGGYLNLDLTKDVKKISKNINFKDNDTNFNNPLDINNDNYNHKLINKFKI